MANETENQQVINAGEESKLKAARGEIDKRNKEFAKETPTDELEEFVNKQQSVAQPQTSQGQGTSQSSQDQELLQLLQGLASLGSNQKQQGTSGATKESVLSDIQSLSQTPVRSGERQGIIPSLLGGHGLDRPEIMEPLGRKGAKDVLSLLQQRIAQEQGVRQFEAGVPKLEAETTLAERKVQEGTPEGKETALQFDIRKTKALESAKAEVKLTAERVKKSQEIQTNFDTTVGFMKGLIGQAKGAGEEQGGLGLLPGLWGKVNTAFKNPNFSRTASVQGQIDESSLVYNRILTGQNRVIKGVVQMVKGTFLNMLDPGSTMAAKTTQSVRNSFRIKQAFQKVGWTPDILNKMTQAQLDTLPVEAVVNSITMTPEETAQLDGIVKDVLATPAVQSEELPGFEKGKAGIFGFRNKRKVSASNQKSINEIKGKRKANAARRAEIKRQLGQ